MGCNTATSTENSTSQSFIEGMGAQEKSVIKKLQDLGMNQADALKFVMDQAKSGAGTPGLIGLQGNDQALLDQAYGGAETNLRRQANLLGQDMAGTRGLNRSDTPVSESVLREMLPQFANLDSAKASQSLGLGLNLSQMRQQNYQQNMQNLLYGSQVAPQTLTGLGQRFQNERFARGITTGTNTMRSNPGLMTQIGQGIGLAGQLGGFLSDPSGLGHAAVGGGGGGVAGGNGAGGGPGSAPWNGVSGLEGIAML